MRQLLDVLKNVEHWTGYTRHFGPPSGADPKLADAVRRYLFTIVGYGCNLGRVKYRVKSQRKSTAMPQRYAAAEALWGSTEERASTATVAPTDNVILFNPESLIMTLVPHCSSVDSSSLSGVSKNCPAPCRKNVGTDLNSFLWPNAHLPHQEAG